MIHAAASAKSATAWGIVIGGAIVAWSVLLLQYPFGADDVFDNILRGRMIDVYGANPYLEVGGAFPSDPFFPYAAWINAPSVYGPAWELTAALTTRLAGMGVVENVIAFKLLGALFLAGSGALIALTLAREDRGRVLAGVIALVWHPVILYETLGNGHNDIAMVFWIIAAAWAASRNRYTLAVVSLTIGALFKFVPLMLLPAMIALAFRHWPGRRERFRFLLASALLSASIAVLVYAPFWRGIKTLGLWWRVDLFSSSMPSVVRLLLEPVAGAWAAGRIVTLIALLTTFGFAVWRARRMPASAPWKSFAATAATTLLFFLLVTCPWRMQWYSLWPLAVSALLPPGRISALANILGYTSLSNQLVVGPLMYWNREAPVPLVREFASGPLILLASWFYALFAMAKSRRIGAGRLRCLTAC
jgi:hypothetical protein